MRLKRGLLWGGVGIAAAAWFAKYIRPQHSPLVLADKVVVITGASSGIGRALAFSFARRGARVVLVARSEDRLEAVRREIEPYTSDVLVVPADLTDEAQMKATVERVLAAYGRIDVLVNNAGLNQGGMLTDLDPARLEKMVRLNLWAVMRLTQLVLPTMQAQHHGYILNVGSGLSRVAIPQFTTYTATKYGVAGFTDALRRELGASGIRISLLLPGWTHTEMVPPDVDDLLERYGYSILNPDEVAERAIKGLLAGEHDIILGGLMERLGIFTERYAPFVLRLYWRIFMTQEWIDAMSRIGRGESES